MQKNLIYCLSFSIILITIPSILQWSNLPINITAVWWIIDASILILFWTTKVYLFDVRDSKHVKFVEIYLIWNSISIFRGMFVAENYWEWKNLVGTGMILLLPICIYMATNPYVVKSIVVNWLRYALVFFFPISLSFIYSDAVGRYLIPISFLLLFFPILPTKWKAISIFFAVVVFLADLNARSNVIKFAIPILFSLTYYLRTIFSKKILNIGRITLLASPIVFFSLGVTDVFNIFRMSDYISGNYKTTSMQGGVIKENDLTSDTRTFLYEEVLSSAFKNNYSFFGRTPARGNESASFGLYNKEELKTGKMERFSNEVSILNVFTWTGLVGVILYLIVFAKASYLAINRSNNYIVKIVGLYVAFRWAYAWVEDFSNFDLSSIFLWIMIGMCYSSSFRVMNDRQIKSWVSELFVFRLKRKRVIQASALS